MNSHRGVWVVTSDPATAEAVSAALRTDTRLTTEGVCPTLAELVTRLESTSAPAVLVDIDPHPRQTLAALEPIITRFQGTRFLVLSQSMQSELVLEAMQIGSRHFLTKPSIASQLGGVLHRLIPNGSIASDRQGLGVTLLSASGGCGLTTLAVNLAQELQLLSSESVLLVDLDAVHGGAATYLGLEGQFGLADVLAYNGPIDAQLVLSTAATYSERFHVLLSPASTHPSEPAPLSFTPLRQALVACKQAYPLCVFDAPRVPLDVAAQLVMASQLTLLVLQQTVRDVRSARALLGALSARGVPAGQVLPLINRYQRHGHVLTFAEAQQALGADSVARVSNDFKSAMRSGNYGKPLAEVAPRSVVRKDLMKLARQVVESRSVNGLVGAAR